MKPISTPILVPILEKNGSRAFKKIARFLKHSRRNEVQVTVIGTFRDESSESLAKAGFHRYVIAVKQLPSLDSSK